MPRSMDELISQADELEKAFEDYEPSDDDRLDSPLLQLRRAAWRRAQTERDLLAAVRTARDAGESWARIGEQLGTSGEAARQRYADATS